MSFIKFIGKGAKTTPVNRFKYFPVSSLPVQIPREAITITYETVSGSDYMRVAIDFDKCLIADLTANILHFAADLFNSTAKQSVKVAIETLTSGHYDILLDSGMKNASYNGVFWVTDKSNNPSGMFQRFRHFGSKPITALTHAFMQLHPGGAPFGVLQNCTGFILNLWEMTNSIFPDDLETWKTKIVVTIYDENFVMQKTAHYNQTGDFGVFELTPNQRYYVKVVFDSKIALIFAFTSDAAYASYSWSEMFCNWLLQTREFPVNMKYPKIIWEFLYYSPDIVTFPAWMQGYAEIQEQLYKENIFAENSTWYKAGAELAEKIK